MLPSIFSFHLVDLQVFLYVSVISWTGFNVCLNKHLHFILLDVNIAIHFSHVFFFFMFDGYLSCMNVSTGDVLIIQSPLSPFIASAPTMESCTEDYFPSFWTGSFYLSYHLHPFNGNTFIPKAFFGRPTACTTKCNCK